LLDSVWGDKSSASIVAIRNFHGKLDDVLGGRTQWTQVREGGQIEYTRSILVRGESTRDSNDLPMHREYNHACHMGDSPRAWRTSTFVSCVLPHTLRMRTIFEDSARYAPEPERYRLAVPSVPFPPQESDSAKTCRHEIAHVSHRYIRQLSATVVPTTCSPCKRCHPLPTSTGINFASLGRKGCTIMPDGYISRPPARQAVLRVARRHRRRPLSR